MLRKIILISLAIAGCMADNPTVDTDIIGTISRNLYQALNNVERFAVNNARVLQDTASPVVNIFPHLLPSVLSSSPDIRPAPGFDEITASIFRYFKAIFTYQMELIQMAQSISERVLSFQIFPSIPENFELDDVRDSISKWITKNRFLLEDLLKDILDYMPAFPQLPDFIVPMGITVNDYINNLPESTRATFGNILDFTVPLLSMDTSDTLETLLKALPLQIKADISASTSPNISDSILPNVATSTSSDIAVSTLPNVAVTTSPNIAVSTLTNLTSSTTQSIAVTTPPNIDLLSSLTTGFPMSSSTANPTSATTAVPISSKKRFPKFPNIFNLTSLFSVPKFNFTF
ncbi:uncharacterized protein LOC126882880 isoform X2 [Diabrotica virgifera virgifera]|uniref:Cell wall protein DAN4-like n=1 Tax=Diabrotica virgifera virgifera TaxID=50390 RepID=A0ABM5K132_DIAVI|nr:uncharacterized protein LOC126882880 isoform X2 [Diabrotica virgifera virgifera]